MNTDWYEGREQTFLKHLVLKRYLQIVAIKIGMAYQEFVYVDGFSGPWESRSPDLSDTSFMIAIDILKDVREVIGASGRRCRIRCLFIEKDPKAFAKLKAATSSVSRIKVETKCGEFEQLVPDVLDFLGPSFGFIFIDPTSWQGIGLKKISPVLKARGEVLINFMFDFIQRFLDVPNPRISSQMDELMGGEDWYDDFQTRLAQGWGREEAIVEVYKDRVKKIGGFKFVSYIRVMKPTSDRSYFYLVYGTDKLIGIQEFSKIEQKFVTEQEDTRTKAKDRHKEDRTHTMGLFGAGELPKSQSWYADDRDRALKHAETYIPEQIKLRSPLTFGELLGELLEWSFIWETDVQSLVKGRLNSGEIRIDPPLRPRERKVKAHHQLRWTGA